MSRKLLIGCVLASLLAAAQTKTGAIQDDAMPTPMPEVAEPSIDPGIVARNAYRSGIDHRDRGNGFERQAATQSPNDAEKTKLKAVDEFKKALADFKHAVELDPAMYQAFNGMGYAYRKTGDYVRAIENYDLALKLAPNFPEAMENRGEAYLGLNRVEDVKTSYLALFAVDRKQADVLLKAMAAWVTAHQSGAPGVTIPEVLAFDLWVKERARIAVTTVSMSLTRDEFI